MSTNKYSPHDLRIMAAATHREGKFRRAESLYEEAERLEHQLFGDPKRQKLAEKHRKARRVISTEHGPIWG